jgi:hypothetical protein
MTNSRGQPWLGFALMITITSPIACMARDASAVFSSDRGATWGQECVLRHGAGEPDLGYTRTVQRPDGRLVTVYYWVDEPRAERFLAATIWSAPKVD